MQDIMRHLLDSRTLLLSADYEISMKRRDAIKHYLNLTVRVQLCSGPQNKVTECCLLPFFVVNKLTEHKCLSEIFIERERLRIVINGHGS